MDKKEEKIVNTITLPELTKKALEKTLADPMLSLFLDEKTKEVIREKSKGQLKDW